MPRWLPYPLMLAVVLCCFCARPALADVTIDPNDGFDDGVIDTTKWVPWAAEGFPAIEETGGRAVLTLPANDTAEWMVDTNLTSKWKLRGPFDIQVDYALLDWPSHNNAVLGIMLDFTSDSGAAVRASGRTWVGDTDETYLYQGPECACEGPTATADMAGKLRVTRDADSLLTSYYWSGGGWVAFNSRTVATEDAQVALRMWAVVPEPGMKVAFDSFQVNSGEVIYDHPLLQEVRMDRGSSRNLWDEAGYHQRVSLRISATAAHPVICVVINDPGGGQYAMSTCRGGGWPDWSSPTAGDLEYWYHQDGDYTINCGFDDGNRSGPPEGGTYRVQIGYGDNPDTVPLTYTTPPVPAVAAGEPSLLLTAPGVDSVTSETQPVLSWTGAPYADVRVRVHPDGPMQRPPEDDEGFAWSTLLTDETSVTYNSDGAGAPLEPGHSYLWEVESRQFVGDLAAAPHISLWTTQVARHRLAEYGPYPVALPDLPGKLGFVEWLWGGRDAGNTAVRAYSPNPGEQNWFTAEGPRGCADFSWDGTKLLYQRRNSQLWVRDAAAGSPAVQVPGVGARYEASWSPDATQLVYTSTREGAKGVWIVNEDGSDPVLLAPSEADDVRYSRWSPDGVWISYQACCDAGESRVWLIRADGTESRELRLSITGITGYPGYSVTKVDQPVWSPDARQLALVFTAANADESDTFTAIGVVSPEGGEITPIFFNPPGYVCCAGPSVSCWSPDGTAIIFSSGYHLPVDPEWNTVKVEPGVELWMIPADGSREPVRLTYNASYDHYATWWAPNTLAGEDVPVVKGDAAITFAQVIAEGSTRLSVTSDVPAPAPPGYSFASDLWSSATTAAYEGAITISLKYDESVAGAGRALALMQWNPTRAKWQNIAARPIDRVNRMIRGRTRSLGLFVVCVRDR